MSRILIVDDEHDIVEMIRFALEADGHEVHEAKDGMDGLEKARALVPDIILLDVMMPKLDGYKVCRMLKFDSKYREIAIVLLTARTGFKDVTIGMEVGADRYLTKPFDVSEVVDLVNQITGDGHAAG
ncbi:MAG: hypothetical protein A2Z06_03200 [Candidatus Glassbacteria bacterium RBG_16_58_8]|uniref:Response regulatory domain-containing protein n=1 Tax=Candidatus Glassbacteria bacterium RBG_16_58_8 TaxID=1817866 RepID=A0A1F5YCQ8_9BACT|nr:MAG: hypothetical protein A2Z06_03200 [Candidatus Glassbacteria bacterium RBG_16_58_8]